MRGDTACTIAGSSGHICLIDANQPSVASHLQATHDRSLVTMTRVPAIAQAINCHSTRVSFLPVLTELIRVFEGGKEEGCKRDNDHNCHYLNAITLNGRVSVCLFG